MQEDDLSGREGKSLTGMKIKNILSPPLALEMAFTFPSQSAWLFVETSETVTLSMHGEDLGGGEALGGECYGGGKACV